MVVSNRNLLFQGSIFRGYVTFREGTWSCKIYRWLKTRLRRNYCHERTWHCMEDVWETMIDVHTSRTPADTNICFMNQTISGLVFYLNSMKLSTKNYQSLIQHAKTWTGLPVLILPVYTPAQQVKKYANMAQSWTKLSHIWSSPTYWVDMST